MGIADVTDKTAVLKAIAEFDQIGEEAFLDKYAFGRSYRFMVNHDARRYDSKARLGAAYRYQFPKRAPLGRGDFSGGAQTTTVLQRLGFTEVRVDETASEGEHWLFQCAD